MYYSIKKIASAIDADAKLHQDSDIQYLLTDSRTVYYPKESLFFALETSTNNGHKYRSRHGAPVRQTHSTASRNKRLFLPVTPQSLGLPDNKGSIRFHCSSINTFLIIINSPSYSIYW